MTSLLIIAVMISILLGATAYTLMNASASLTSQINRTITEARLEEAARGILANIVVSQSSSPVYYVPAPDSLTTPNIPSWIMNNATTASGLQFWYCPYTNQTPGGPTSSISTSSGSSYTAQITTLYTGGKNYLYSSASRPSNAPSALAIIVAPGDKATIAGDCSSITTSGTIAGSMVRVITEADVLARDTINASSGNQLYAATSASGDGSGRSANNAAAFDVAMTYTNQYRPQYMQLNLASGTYTTTDSVFSQAYVSSRALTTSRNAAIDFRGAGYSSTIITGSSSFDAQFASNLYLKGVGFEPNSTNYINLIIDRTNTLITDNSRLHRFVIYSGGNGYFLGTTYFLGGSGGNIYNYLGTIYVGGTHNLASGTNFTSGYYWSEGGTLIYGAGSNLVMNSSNGGAGCGYYTYGPTRYIYVDSTITGYTGSTMALGCMYPVASYLFSNTVINNWGNELLTNFYVGIWDRGTTWNFSPNTPNTAILGSYGAELYITNTTIGSSSLTSSRPTNKVVNTQASNTNGSGTTLLAGGSNGGWTISNLAVNPTWGNTCWAGTDDFYAATGTQFRNGSYSKSVGAIGYEPWLIANRSNWYCYN